MNRPPSATVIVPPDKLPASCPPSAQWDRHPRVYLPLSRRHPRRACPYCGALHILEGSDSAGDAPS